MSSTPEPPPLAEQAARVVAWMIERGDVHPSNEAWAQTAVMSGDRATLALLWMPTHLAGYIARVQERHARPGVKCVHDRAWYIDEAQRMMALDIEVCTARALRQARREALLEDAERAAAS